MANYNIKVALDTHFKTNWTQTKVQFHGQQLDMSGESSFISLIYAPLDNTPYGFNGTAQGRIEYGGLQKVFCYAKNPTKALKLADDVKTFLNGIELPNNIHVNIGQDTTPRDLGNGFWEVLCNFDLSQWD